MNNEVIRQLIKDKGFNINSLSKAIGMTHVGLSKALENNTISVSILEKIAEVLEVSPCYFFQQETNNQSLETKYKFLRDEILAKGELYIDTSSFVDNARRVLSISDDLLKLINTTLTKEEINYVLKYSMRHSDKSFDEIKSDMIHLLGAIEDIANKKHYDKLYFEIVNERGYWSTKLIETILNDPHIIFLRGEKLIDDSELLSNISIYAKGIESSQSYLLKYFEIKDIRRAFKGMK